LAFSIDDWNVNENREWFIRLYDNGSNIGIRLFHTQSVAESQSNIVDSGTASFGTEQECTLAGDTELFQDDYTWHLKVSGADEDVFKIFRIKPFVELDEITHSIYRSSALITLRAKYEVDVHTHATMTRDLPLGSHLPTLEVGDIIRLNSVRRDVNDLSQVSSHSISGNKNSITTQIETVKFVAVTR